jgi:putative FmdB family regulatory protein
VPIYDYICGSCRHRFEVLRGLNEAGPSQCPLCGGAVSRAFAPPTIVFKGSGWAKVDRRSTVSRARRSSDGEASPGPAPAASGGSDADGSGGSQKRDSGGSDADGSGGSPKRDSKRDSGGSPKRDSGGSQERDSSGSAKTPPAGSSSRASTGGDD